MTKALPRLLWISPGIAPGVLDRLADLGRAGLEAVQLRDKQASARELADAVLAARQRFAGTIVVNDRVDVCLATGADGVQLGGRSLPVAVVRRMLGTALWIGKSVHDRAELAEAEEGRADFVLVSPFGVVEKPGQRPLPPLGVDGLAEFVRSTALPVFALGGVEPGDVPAILATGAAGVAVQSGLAAGQPTDRVGEYLGAFA